MVKARYQAFVRAAKRSAAYWRQLAVRDFTEGLVVRMSRLRMSQADLARAIDARPAYVSRILRGSDNFTLATMVKLAMAVGAKVRVHVADQDAHTIFADTFRSDTTLEYENEGEVDVLRDIRVHRSGADSLVQTNIGIEMHG